MIEMRIMKGFASEIVVGSHDTTTEHRRTGAHPAISPARDSNQFSEAF